MFIFFRALKIPIFSVITYEWWRKNFFLFSIVMGAFVGCSVYVVHQKVPLVFFAYSIGLLLLCIILPFVVLVYVYRKGEYVGVKKQGIVLILFFILFAYLAFWGVDFFVGNQLFVVIERYCDGLLWVCFYFSFYATHALSI